MDLGYHLAFAGIRFFSLSPMQYALKFSTIASVVVMLTACQPLVSPPTHSTPDPGTDVAAKREAPIEPIVLPDFSMDVQLASGAEDEALAPVIAPAQPIAPPPAEVWDRIRAGMTLDHHLDEARVAAELRWFARHQAYLDRVATRASRYLYHIVEAVEARGLPMEIALLPIVESAFDPFAYSHGRASGLWQFIPGTAKRFGLDIDYWYDGRRDVPEATRAALDYLEVLYRFLGDDWLRALAAYNSGEGNVRYAVRRNERAGREVDFWSLSLPRETEAYVPRLLAISALIADPERYGVTLKAIPDKPYWEFADIGSQTDLAKIAELADVTTEELYLLNPAFNKWSTRPRGPHRILLPVGKAAPFEAALAELAPSQRLRWARHEIRSGESLGTIAQRYGTTVDTLKSVNKLRGHLIRAGDALLIPMATASEEQYALSEDARLESSQARVQARTGVEPTRYIVRSGDSFWKISRRFGVSMRELAKWNGLAPTDPLTPGQELKLFTQKPLEIASAAPESNPVIRRINYSVRNGESLSMIGSRFNVSIEELRKWNRDVARQKYLQPGDRITLYVDVTNTD